MAVQITFTAANAVDAAKEIHNFVCAVQNPTTLITASTQPPITNEHVKEGCEKFAEPEKTEKPKKAVKAKEAAPAEKAADVASTYTLQEVMDIAKKAIIDSGDEVAGKLRCEKINKSFGITRVRELPPEKLDDYVEAIKAEFPAKAQTGMFD